MSTKLFLTHGELEYHWYVISVMWGLADHLYSRFHQYSSTGCQRTRKQVECPNRQQTSHSIVCCSPTRSGRWTNGAWRAETSLRCRHGQVSNASAHAWAGRAAPSCYDDMWLELFRLLSGRTRVRLTSNSNCTIHCFTDTQTLDLKVSNRVLCTLKLSYNISTD